MGVEGARYSEQVGEFAAELVDVLSPIGDVSWKKMFGGAGVFVDDTMFALIDSAATLHLKVGDANRAQFEAAGSHKHNRMPYYVVPADVLADDDALVQWARSSADVARG